MGPGAGFPCVRKPKTANTRRRHQSDTSGIGRGILRSGVRVIGVFVGTPSPRHGSVKPEERPCGSVPERYENDRFFAAQGLVHPAPASIPEDVFYSGPRPAPETSLTTRLTASPFRFAAALFLVGWAGILFQASFLQQVVFGAPVFEEFAKFGLALLVASVLSLRAPWLLIPLAWVSGGAFGYMEHHVTYPEEDVFSYGERIAFHATTAGLSMAVFCALRDAPDTRALWATTALSTLLHWANNFGAVVLGLSGVFVPQVHLMGLGWSLLMTTLALVLTVPAFLALRLFRERVHRSLGEMVPRLGLEHPPATAVAAAPAPPVFQEPAREPPSPEEAHPTVRDDRDGPRQ